jgi:hypothetical protein
MIPALIAAAAVFVYVWSDRVHRCQDGDRYTSRRLQPTPFNRRFCSWPPRLLMWLTWASFVAIAALLGGWKQALMFVTLPGVAFCVNLPTTTDGPSMLLAWCSALLMPTHPWASVAVSCVSGFIHERSPAFAALYAWHPLPLLGMLVPLIAARVKGAALPDRASREPADALVGHSLFGAIHAHRSYVQLLSPSGLVWTLRGLPVMAAWAGVSMQAWATLGVAFASRVIGTDTSRFLMWGALPLIRDLDPPVWMVAIQLMTWRRAGQ